MRSVAGRDRGLTTTQACSRSLGKMESPTTRNNGDLCLKLGFNTCFMNAGVASGPVRGIRSGLTTDSEHLRLPLNEVVFGQSYFPLSDKDLGATGGQFSFLQRDLARELISFRGLLPGYQGKSTGLLIRKGRPGSSGGHRFPELLLVRKGFLSRTGTAGQRKLLSTTQNGGLSTKM